MGMPEEATGDPQAGPASASRRRIPRGTPAQPAKPLKEVFEVKDLSDMTSNWTNDGNEMELNTYFNPATSNLSMSFNIDGLQPVIRQNTSSIYLLMDANRNFYKWNSEESGLYLVVDATDLESALDLVINHPVMINLQRMGNNTLGNRS